MDPNEDKLWESWGGDQGDFTSKGGGSRGSSWWSQSQGNLLWQKKIEGISIGFRSQRVNKTGRKVRRVIKNHESHLHSIP